MQRKFKHSYGPLVTILATTAAAGAIGGWLAAAIAAPAALPLVYALFLFWWKAGRRRRGKARPLDMAAYLNVLVSMVVPWRVGVCECCFGIVDTKFDPCAKAAA